VNVWLERAGNLAHALRRRREHDGRMRWSRDRLDTFRDEQLASLVRYAAEHSPFYRKQLGALPSGRIELGQLPVLRKDSMMSSFDDLVTDRRVRLERLKAHLPTIRGDDLLDGELRVMSSSGSSGQKAIFVYDRAAWRGGFLQGSLRMTKLAGLRPRLPRRPRLATLAAPDGKHMTFRGGMSMDVGLFITKRFAATLPLPELVAGLEAYQPEFLIGYPSMLALLAEEQCAGRMRIQPATVVTSSEVRTTAMTERIRAAWNVNPFDCLGLTETGIAAMDCEHHAGLHVFEDLTIIEVVDANNREVPFGTPGAKLLVTNLYNRVQPIIRFEVSDLVTMTDGACACGSTFRRIVALDGRSDDMIEVGQVRIHPIHIRGVLASEPAVLQYQVTQERARLDVQVVLGGHATGETTQALSIKLATTIRAHGAELPVVVRQVATIAREDGAGKLKLVRRPDRWQGVIQGMMGYKGRR
jgi:phenylacetate-CoA ligase